MLVLTGGNILGRDISGPVLLPQRVVEGRPQEQDDDTTDEDLSFAAGPADFTLLPGRISRAEAGHQWRRDIMGVSSPPQFTFSLKMVLSCYQNMSPVYLSRPCVSGGATVLISHMVPPEERKKYIF